jgi:ribosomal protein L22
MPRLKFKNFANTIVSFFRTDATSARVYQFQDRNGTIADDTDLAAKAPINNPTFTGTVAGITKTMVGLPNVDNTADTAKPVSTAQQTALDGKQTANAQLTAIAGLTPSNDDIIQRKSGSWINRTMAQLKVDLGLVKADVGLGNVDNTSDATKNAATATLTNKRITKRVQSVVSNATVTADSDADDMVIITAQAAGLTLSNPTGTPTLGQQLIYRIKDNGTARTIAYGANFRALGVTLPSTTVISKTLYLGCIWNVADSKWDVTGVSQEI